MVTVDTDKGGRNPQISLIVVFYRALNTVLFDVPMTEVLSLKKALAACRVPDPPTLEHWIMPQLKGRCWTEHMLVLGLIFAPVPLLPEMCLGFGLALVAYMKVAIVLTVIGFPFCFGFFFLIWAHTWCFLWWPVFFSYYIIRGVMYGVPCRMKLVCEGFHLALRYCKEVLLAESSSGRRTSNGSPQMNSRSSPKASPQMASLSTQAAWVAASAASAAGVDAGWRFVGKDITTSPSTTAAKLSSRGSPRAQSASGISDESLPAMRLLPRAQVELPEPTSMPSTSAQAPTMNVAGHLSPMLNQSQGSAMASAG